MRHLFLFSLMLVCSTSANAQDKPNIVLLFADNFGYGELGSYGGGLTRVRRHRASTPWLAKARG